MSSRLVFLLLSLPVFSQAQFSPYATLKKISCPEKRWVIFHPFTAGKAYRVSMEARMLSQEMEKDDRLDHDADGGQVDAFRHAYWMARLAQEMCWRKARRLGKVHERGNYLDFKKNRAGEEVFSDAAASSMDLYNNISGIGIGRMHKLARADEIKQFVIEAILRGDMKIIRKNAAGKSLRCDGTIIELENYAGQWNIPRCLVDSDMK